MIIVAPWLILIFPLKYEHKQKLTESLQEVAFLLLQVDMPILV